MLLSIYYLIYFYTLLYSIVFTSYASLYNLTMSNYLVFNSPYIL